MGQKKGGGENNLTFFTTKSLSADIFCVDGKANGSQNNWPAHRPYGGRMSMESYCVKLLYIFFSLLLYICSQVELSVFACMSLSLFTASQRHCSGMVVCASVCMCERKRERGGESMWMHVRGRKHKTLVLN